MLNDICNGPSRTIHINAYDSHLDQWFTNHWYEISGGADLIFFFCWRLCMGASNAKGQGMPWMPCTSVRHWSLTCHRLGYWRTLECLGGGGGGGLCPLISQEPLVVESRARRHSKALHKTHQNHLSELKIEVTCEVKVRSKVKIWRFDVLGPGDQDYRTWWLKLRQNVVKGMVEVWYEYKWSTKKTSRSRSGHKRSLYERIVIKSCDTRFMAQFRRKTQKSELKYHLA